MSDSPPPDLIDISIPLSDATPPWPGDTPFSCGWTCRREQGDSVNLGVLTTSAHVGTHADAPMHVESAWAPSESLPASVFVGPCVVVALPSSHDIGDDISAHTLSELLSPYNEAVHDAVRTSSPLTRVLLRTGYSVASGRFPDDWPALSDDGAAWLLAHGMKLWGSDAPSADRRTSTVLPIHHALFDGGAYVLENLALDGVAPGLYELLAQPIAVYGADAAPVRALLRPLTRSLSGSLP